MVHLLRQPRQEFVEVYNHLLATQNPWNGDFSYYTPLVGRKEHNHELCSCVSSGPRGISLIPRLVWGLQGDAFVVNLYAPGREQLDRSFRFRPSAPERSGGRGGSAIAHAGQFVEREEAAKRVRVGR